MALCAETSRVRRDVSNDRYANGKNKMYLEKFRLDRKTAVVTGAGQGIGLACAEALAEAGAKVVIADRDPKAAETGRASLKAKGLNAEVVMMDVTDSGRVGEVADQLVSRYSGIDILVNNAGHCAKRNAGGEGN